MEGQDIYKAVEEQYGQVAKHVHDQQDQENHERIAKAFGYSVDELASIPDGANLGLGCGNPLAVAGLKEGETVIDLGSGAGFDVFLTARKVGPNGKAIGVDMSKDMLDRARANAEKSGVKNVSFVESVITDIALPSASSKDGEGTNAGCIISNCVINLVPEQDKQKVFNEMFRLLKPGGRVAVSDILAKKELPDKMKKNLALYVACISGASTVNNYEKYLREAGFKDIMIVDAQADLNVYKDAPTVTPSNGEAAQKPARIACCTPAMSSLKQERSSCCPPPAAKASTSCCAPKSNGTVEAPKKTSELQNGFYSSLGDIDLNEWVGSYKVYAVKPKE